MLDSSPSCFTCGKNKPVLNLFGGSGEIDNSPVFLNLLFFSFFSFLSLLFLLTVFYFLTLSAYRTTTLTTTTYYYPSFSSPPPFFLSSSVLKPMVSSVSRPHIHNDVATMVKQETCLESISMETILFDYTEMLWNTQLRQAELYIQECFKTYPNHILLHKALTEVRTTHTVGATC